MYFYIKGKVVEQYGSFIVLDNNNIGYLINVANPYSFELNKEYEVYTLRAKGFTYQEIASLLNTTTKSVDGALSRIKTKINNIKRID